MTMETKKDEAIMDPQFDKYFPGLISGIGNLTKDLDFSKLQTMELRIQAFERFFPQFYPEIEKTIPYWSWLKTQSLGTISFHILRMLYCVLHDPDFSTLSPFHQNVLKWTVLLHDIAKRGTPTLEKGMRDPAHPYTSAAEALEVLSELFKLKGTSSEIKVKTLQATLRGSILNDTVTDLSKLEYILCQAADIFPLSSFGYIVFKLVVMHQALPTIPEFKQPAELSEDQIKKFCDKEFLGLMRIVMINDSINYHMHKPEMMLKYRNEFEELIRGYFKLIEM